MSETDTDTAPRILPGHDGRADYLDDLLKAGLRAECDLLDAELSAAAEAAEAAEAPAPPAPDPFAGMVPLVLHVDGVEWNGTQKRLVRCAAAGELADFWLVQVGSKMVTKSGHPIPFKPYRHVSPSLQDKIRFTLPEARAMAAKVQAAK